MATLVRCLHCGAPHRTISAREDFVCAYCRGTNRCESGFRFEELVCPLRLSAEGVRRSVLRELESRGLPELPVTVKASVLLPIWQFVTAEGEEFVLPAGLREHPISAAVRPPAAPLLSRDDPELGEVPGLPGAPEIPREEAEAAALAAFDHHEAPIESVRLLWYAVSPIRVQTRVGPLEGLFLEGSEKLLLESVPPAAHDEPLRGDLLLSLLVFFVLSLGWGASADSWPARVLGVGICCAVAWFWFRKFLPAREAVRP